MCSKYQSGAIVIPEGFPELVKGFAREVLRSQPANVYEFGAKYFADLAAARTRTAAGSGGEGGASGAPGPDKD